MNWKLAPSNEAAGWKIKGEAFKENGKRYIMAEKWCGRCGGKGKIPCYGHVEEGICFACDGSGGHEVKRFRCYNEDERAEMDAAAEKRAEKRAEAARAMSQENKKTWFESHNLDENGTMYFPVGCNTYEIKDYLKENGAKYSDAGWYFGNKEMADKIELPAGGFIFAKSFDEVFDWNGKYPRPNYEGINKMKAEVSAIIAKENRATSVSQHYGEIGDRIKKAEAIYKSARVINSDWGSSILYTFEINGNVFTWFTQSVIDTEIQPEDTIVLSGTVKAHTEFNGILQTQLSRCIVRRA